MLWKVFGALKDQGILLLMSKTVGQRHESCVGCVCRGRGRVLGVSWRCVRAAGRGHLDPPEDAEEFHVLDLTACASRVKVEVISRRRAADRAAERVRPSSNAPSPFAFRPGSATATACSSTESRGRSSSGSVHGPSTGRRSDCRGHLVCLRHLFLDLSAAEPLTSVTLEQLETDPHPVLAQLRPIAWVPVLNGWLVTGRELALQVMRDAETFTVDDPRFSTGQVVGPSMLTRDGAEHARHRDPFAAPLRLAVVRERFAPLVEAEVDGLIDRFEANGHAELRLELAGPLARTLSEAARARSRGHRGMLGWYDAIVESVTGVAAGKPPTAEGAAAFEQLRETVEPALESAGDLTAAEVVSNAAVMMFGGIETTEGMIVNFVWHLLMYGGEPTANALEESLRLEPAAAVIDRYATRDVELAGASIRKGDFVEISIAGANRDPATFPEPDRFDPHRENAKLQVAFAHGPHVCVGMHLARLEALAAAERLFARLPGLRLDPEQPTSPRGLVFRKPPRLDVLW